MKSSRRSRHLLRSLTLLLGALASGARVARAQALPTATGPGGFIAVGAMGSGFQVDYGKRWIGGGGVYADANLTWRYGLETEVRQLRYHQEAGVRESTYLIGPRVTLRPTGVMPYAKVLVGVGGFRYPYGYAKGNYLVIAPGAGIDYSLGDRLTLRLLDFEYQDWQNFTYGHLHPYGISFGVSVRVLHGSDYPR